MRTPASSSAAVERARGVVQQRMVGLALQQQRDHDLAPRRAHQRAPEPPRGKEIGVGEDHFRARGVDLLQVGVLDVAPVAQAVAHHQRGALAAAGAGADSGARARACRAAPRQREARPAPAERRPGDARPEPRRLGAHPRGERAFDARPRSRSAAAPAPACRSRR